MNNIKNILGIIFLGVGLNVSAQQSNNSAGGESTGIGQASFSVGQITYTNIESVIDDAVQFQGVQIPFEVFEVFEVVSCPTDFNFDGKTDGEDFSIFLGNYGLTCTGCPTDLSGDGITDGDDFSIFLGNFGLDCPPTE